MRAIIFVNGHVSDYSALAHWVAEGDYLVAADGGTRHCLALGLHPHVIVGDLDSVDPAVVEALVAQGVQIERHPAAKDQTDLELAIERALRDGADAVRLLGALGGRLDQTLANLLILAQRDWPAPIQLAEGNQVAEVMHSGDTLDLHAAVGSTVSVIPLSATVTGITYHGLQYLLTDAVLHFGSTRGVSNVIVAKPATIQIGQGVLLVIQTLYDGS